MYVILSVLAVLLVLILSEFGWRKHLLDNEVGRKFVHISVGSFVAFWPFFLSWQEIRWLSLAFLIVVVVSSRLKLLRAINSVQRPTYGEVFFAITVGLLTFITHDRAVYAAALLQMSLADGFAAIVGTRFGRDNKYHVLGHTKSVVGTATFVIVSVLLLLGYNTFNSHDISVAAILLASTGAALLENISPLGLDNLTVPLYIGLLLTNL
jgi:phytol kinase